VTSSALTSERAYDDRAPRRDDFSSAIGQDLGVLGPRGRRVLVVLVAFVAFVAVTGGGAVVGERPARAATTRKRPNILFVLTDDLDMAELRYLPITRHLLAARGATFDHYYVSNSLCCPSRVTTLRGQFAHNTGVWSNGGTNGGFERAFAEGIEQDTVGTRLSSAGYRTALIGKYLNGYPNGVEPTYRPPGWTTWVSPVFGHPYGEYGYVLNHDGRFEFHGRRPSDYGTNVYVRHTDQFLRSAARAGAPFFAYLAVYAPHQPATPAPRDAGLFPRAHVARSAAFNQRDVHAMPRFVANLPRFGADEKAAIDGLFRLRIRSLQAVDRGVASLVHTLRVTGQLDNTYIVFTSDNGFHLGQHRLPAGKQTAYDTDIHVPLLIRGPGIAAGSHVGVLTGNIDLAPTFDAMADVRAPSLTDGRPLLGLAHGNARAAHHWRTAYLLEHRNEEGVSQSVPRRRSLPLEPPDLDQGGVVHRHLVEPSDLQALARHEPIPNYDAVRTSRFLYVSYANGDRELYDTRADPAEVDNLAGTKPRLERALARRMSQLSRCERRGCRVADSARIPSSVS
jgi:arylsulfatase A-like enzyme